ncbi:chromosome segregation ATPase [Lactobacillus colini]|uniref:Chromosome segregation ATPase n=1 Tax=Lactobacillus colini TaxID=1819254 RepID=A0ABS4MBV7_9LACO|nr:phage scaffolding protein [Lactobacillus colini]MBP2057165.1 chromosome segregation ATPase [Lactobacillus colini]
MNKDFLKELRLKDDAIAKVMKAYDKDIQDFKDQIKTKDDTIAGLNGQVDQSNEQLKALKKQVEGNDDLQKQVAEYQKKMEEMTKNNQAHEAALKKGFAISNAIRDAGGKNAKAIEALLDQETINFEDGKLSGLDKQLEGLKKSDDYLFTSQEKKPQVSFTASGNPSNATNTKQPSLVDKIAARMTGIKE